MARRPLLSCALVLAFLLLPGGSALAASTWYVDGVNGSDANDCLSPSTACSTIGAAITKTSAGDTIVVAAGVYSENVVITKNLTINGAGPASTIVNGDSTNTVLAVNSGITTAISALTVRNGGTGINNSGTLTLTNSAVGSNTASGFNTSGIVNYGTATLTDSTISGNTAGTAGGLFNTGVATLTNVTISGNSAPYGGGIESSGLGTTTLLNVTISGNAATFGIPGGGIRNAGGTVALKNTIVADNVGGNCGGNLVSQGHNLSSDTSCVSFNAAGDLNSTDPKLGPLQNNGGPTFTEALLPSSPAIDAGDNNGCPSTDQRGVSRAQGGACDIGAYEFIPFRVYLPDVADQATSGH
jgi:hypothetical protein